MSAEVGRGRARQPLLTRSDPGFQPRLIGAIEELLRREADAGWLDLAAELSTGSCV
jgi:hypothetical protein